MVELLTDDSCCVVRVHHQLAHPALLVDHAYDAGPLVEVLLAKERGVLVEQHAGADARHVEAIQEVLYPGLYGRLHRLRLLELQHALRHHLHGVLMAPPHRVQRADELAQGLWVALLTLVYEHSSTKLLAYIS